MLVKLREQLGRGEITKATHVMCFALGAMDRDNFKAIIVKIIPTDNTFTAEDILPFYFDVLRLLEVALGRVDSLKHRLGGFETDGDTRRRKLFDALKRLLTPELWNVLCPPHLDLWSKQRLSLFYIPIPFGHTPVDFDYPRHVCKRCRGRCLCNHLHLLNCHLNQDHVRNLLSKLLIDLPVSAFDVTDKMNVPVCTRAITYLVT